MFCDELQLKLVAGKGGDGCVSFRREKFIPRGGPDGGDGGDGGDIILKVSTNMNTLGHLKHNKILKAQKGEHGKGKNMFGKNGKDLIIEVPPGTIVFNIEKSEQLADLSKLGEQIVIAKGGTGGMGNARFTSSTHQAPRFAEKGEPGEEIEVTLELKLIADVGLIGLPSAGKSTLISVISNAKPKIAAYHFTTLTPNLGMVEMSKFGGGKTDSFIVADIPGLIEGASKGKGLGHEFLKHISRTKLLLHIIDCSISNPVDNYKIIHKELKEFSKDLTKLDEIIVLNKIDLITSKEQEKLVKQLEKKLKISAVFPISSVTKEGLKPLLFEVLKKLSQISSKPKSKEKQSLPVLRPHLDNIKYEIKNIKKVDNHHVYIISGRRIEQLFKMTDLNNMEGLERIYNYIEKSGMKKLLEKKKIKLGDKIKVLDSIISYRP